MLSPAPMRKANKKAMNGSLSSGQNIKVFVRVRPLNDIEKASKAFSLVDCPTNKEVVVQERPLDKFTKKFSFDRVFDGRSKQTDIYKSVAKPLVEEVLNGFNCTIFAYGQTGTGKTYTMEGEHCSEGIAMDESHGAGIIPRCVNQLFDELRIQKLEFNMRVSFLELYNEELFDLLSAHDDLSKLRVYEDPGRKGSCIVQGLEEVLVRNKSDVYNIIEKGSSKRQTAATFMNAHSSRSHTVFTVTVHIKENTLEGDELLKTGKLHLVDLAGSENIGRSGAVDKRAREAGNINQSLLTLGRVITSLVEKAPHVPYRESKLTRLLQDTLGGRTKTSIIATISPASVNLEETLSTLDYAHRAKNIQNRPEVNQKLNKKELICEYTNEIEKLRRDLLAMREKNGVYLANENYEEMLTTMEQQAKEIAEKISQIRTLEDELEKHLMLFTEVQEELKSTSEKMQMTETKLSETKEVLRCTQKLLVQTASERDEQRHLVGAHVKTEGELQVQGRNLVNVAKTTMSDLTKLHDKLDRKRKLELLNEETEKTFARDFEERISAMHSSVFAFKEHHTRNSDTVVDQLGDFLFSSVCEMEKLSNHLESMNSLVLNSLSNGNELFSKRIDEKTENYTRLSEKLTKKSSDEGDLLKVFVSEVFEPKVGKMAELLGQQHCAIQALKENVTQKITAITLHCNNVHKRESAILESMREKLEMLKEFPAQIRLELNNKSELLREHTLKYSEMLKMMTNQFLSQVEENDQFLDSQFPLLSEGQQEMVSQAQQNTHQLISDVTTLSEVLKEHQNNSTKSQEEAVNCLGQTIDNIQLDSEVMKSDLGSMDVTVKKQVTMSCSTLEDIVNSLQQSKQEIIDDDIKTKDKLNHDLQTISTNISSAFDSHGNELTSLGSRSQSAINDVQLKLTGSESELDEFLSDHIDQLRESGESVHVLISQQIVKDIPTGYTPMRKDYVYPEMLAATSPHERILNRYRLKMNAPSKIPLPVFGQETEEEVASSPEQGSPSTSCDTSLISEGEKDSSRGFALPLTKSSSLKDCLFAQPSAPLRQDSRKESQKSISRSSSTSSLTDSKENLPGNQKRKPNSKKREIQPPSIITDKNLISQEAPIIRTRKVLGSFN